MTVTPHAAVRPVSLRRVVGFVTLSLLLLMGLWGIFPFRGKTLPLVLAEACRMRFKTAAAIVSVLAGVLGTVGAALVTSRGPRHDQRRSVAGGKEVKPMRLAE